MSLVDKLMQQDVAGFTELPTGKLELPRLSKLMGEPFVVTCRALDGEKFAYIAKLGVDYNKKGNFREFKPFERWAQTVIEGVIDPNMKDKRLQEHFGVPTPKELVKKLFLGGEMQDISNLIQELSGYEPDDEEDDESGGDEIKN